MKLLVVAALVAVAAADRPGAGVQYSAPPGVSQYRSGGQSTVPAGRYGSSPSSSQYGLQSRRKPFQSSLKPVSNGYRQSSPGSEDYSPRSGGYSSQSNGDFSQNNGRYSSQSNGGLNQNKRQYNSQSNSGFSQQPSRSYSKPESTPAPQPYSFSYDVLDVLGNDYGAAEESNGEQVQGQYSVLLPDGRLQTVSYSVQGDSGFVADVQYEGEARFFDADGAEQGRSSVASGAGPATGYGYAAN